MSSERRLNRAGTDALARGVVRLEAADIRQRALRGLVLVERARPRAYTSRSRVNSGAARMRLDLTYDASTYSDRLFFFFGRSRSPRKGLVCGAVDKRYANMDVGSEG